MSLVTPARFQPCWRSASSGPLTSCAALGADGSASHAPSAASSSALDDVWRRGRRRCRRPPPARCRSASRCRGPRCPRKASPTRRPSRACSSSHWLDLVRGRAGWRRRRNPRSASGSAAATVANSRSRSTRNCRLSNSSCTSSRSHCAGPSSSTATVERDVAHQLGQLPVAHDAGEVLAQRVAGLALDRVDLRDQLVERAVLANPLRRGLLPDAGDAGQVVARVAAQRREVRVLRGRQAVLRLDLLRA